jgi:regulator of sigma E protease
VILSAILPGVLLLGILIFFHELGHFLVAKWRGITVLKFSLGLGPEMVGFTSGGTRYCLSWVPLGGFVQMAGDHPNEDGSIPEGGPEQFLTHPWSGRILVAIAGPGANFVFAFLTYIVIFTVVGEAQKDWPSVIGPPDAGSPAESAGLREGDRIRSVGGRPVRMWGDFGPAIDKSDTTHALAVGMSRGDSLFTVMLPPGGVTPFTKSLGPPSPPVVRAVNSGLPAYLAGLKEGDRVLAVDGAEVRQFWDIPRHLAGKAGRDVVLHVKRGDTAFDITVRAMGVPGDTTKLGWIGIEGVGPPNETQLHLRRPFLEAVPLAMRATLSGTRTVYEGLWTTLTQFWQVHEQMGGPIFIAQMARDAARRGLDWWLGLMAMISLALMAFNLLPIPLLDGGHVTLALLEAVRRRAMSAKGYLNFQRAGLILVGTLFVFIVGQDLTRPIRRMRALEKAPRETTTVAPARR